LVMLLRKGENSIHKRKKKQRFIEKTIARDKVRWGWKSELEISEEFSFFFRDKKDTRKTYFYQLNRDTSSQIRNVACSL